MKEKTRKLDDSTVYVIPSVGIKPIKMIIEKEIISQPSNEDFISQFVSMMATQKSSAVSVRMENYFAISAAIMSQRIRRTDDGSYRKAGGVADKFSATGCS